MISSNPKPELVLYLGRYHLKTCPSVEIERAIPVTKELLDTPSCLCIYEEEFFTNPTGFGNLTTKKEWALGVLSRSGQGVSGEKDPFEGYEDFFSNEKSQIITGVDGSPSHFETAIFNGLFFFKEKLQKLKGQKDMDNELLERGLEIIHGMSKLLLQFRNLGIVRLLENLGTIKYIP